MRLLLLTFSFLTVSFARAAEIPQNVVERLQVLIEKEAEIESGPAFSPQAPMTKILKKVREEIRKIRREYEIYSGATADFNRRFPKGVFAMAKFWAETYAFRDLTPIDRSMSAESWAKDVAAKYDVKQFEDFKSSFIKLYTYAKSNTLGGYGWDHHKALVWAIERARTTSPDDADRFVKASRDYAWRLWEHEREIIKALQSALTTCNSDLADEESM